MTVLRELRVYSIGHSSLDETAFFAALERFGVRRLVDVRRYPGSRRHPQFSRASLERSCARASVDYVRLGDALGGFREGSYETHMESEDFREGIERLDALSLEIPTAFLCAEKHPFHCHRRFIAEALSARGRDVRHIVDGQLLLCG